MKTSVFPADAEVPALSANTSIALDVAMGRAMVVPAVQMIIGTNTVRIESPSLLEIKSITTPEKKIRPKPTMI
ncbi:hypothetical protein D9M73_253030 [compost metagenome]